MIDHTNHIKTLQLNTQKIYKKKSRKIKLTSLPNIYKYTTNHITIHNNKHIYNHTPIYTHPITLRQKEAKRVIATDINSLYPFSLINRLPVSKIQEPQPQKTIIFYKILAYPPNFQRIPYKHIYNHTPIYTQQSHLDFLKKSNYQITTLHRKKVQYSTNIFTDLVLHIYTQKHTHTHTTKLLLNSLYGKLARWEKSKTSLTVSTMLCYATTLMHKLKCLTSNPPCYSDTDSLFTRHPSTQKISEAIGHAKINTLDSLTIHKPRNYKYTTINNRHSVHKGTAISSQKAKDILPKNLISIVRFIYNI